MKIKIKNWLWQAPVGFVLIGAGLSMAIDAGINKANQQAWFWYGTFALIIFNSGICVFGDAVVKRVKNEIKR